MFCSGCHARRSLPSRRFKFQMPDWEHWLATHVVMSRCAPPRRDRSRAYQDPDYEDRIKLAIKGLRNKNYSGIREASRKEQVIGLVSTLRDRMNDRHKPYKVHMNSLQAVEPTEESVLIQWIKQSAESGTPMDHQPIRARASDIAGSSLEKCWKTRFKKRHPELVTSKPAKLDPKRAKNFNETIVKDYFDKWEALKTECGGIPPTYLEYG